MNENVLEKKFLTSAETKKFKFCLTDTFISLNNYKLDDSYIIAFSELKILSALTY